MRSSELLRLLEESRGLSLIKSRLADPLDEFRKASQIRGASAPVVLTTENNALLVCERHIRRICDGYLLGILDEVEVEYIATALELCPDFVAESEGIREALFRLSEICQANPREVVEDILATL